MKDIQAKLDELKSSLEKEITEKQKTEIAAQIKAVSDQIEELKKGQLKADELKALTDRLDAAEQALKDNQPVIDAFVKDGNKRTTSTEKKSFQQAFGEAIEAQVDEFKSFSKTKSRDSKIVIDLKDFAFKTVGDMTTAVNLSGDPVFSYNTRQGLIPRDRINFRDLIPTAYSATGQYVTYREGAGEGTPAQQTEGSAKAQIDSDFTNLKTVSSYLAAYQRFSKQLMYNLPWLQTTLSRILLRRFYQKENLLFYQNLATNSDPLVTTSGGNVAEKIVDMIAEQGGKNFNSDVILLTYADWSNLMKTRLPSTGTSYSIPGSVVFDASGNARIAGVPVIPAPWVTTGDIQSIDMDYIERVEVESMRVEFSFEDANNFTENKVTARIECLEELNLLRVDAHSNYGTAS